MLGIVAHTAKGGPDARAGFIDKTFKDRNGKVVLAMLPNAPLWIWIVAEIISAVTRGTVHKAAAVIAFIALLIWAIWELASGVNYFRRALGLAILLGMIAAGIRLLN